MAPGLRWVYGWKPAVSPEASCAEQHGAKRTPVSMGLKFANVLERINLPPARGNK